MFLKGFWKLVTRTLPVSALLEDVPRPPSLCPSVQEPLRTVTRCSVAHSLGNFPEISIPGLETGRAAGRGPWWAGLRGHVASAHLLAGSRSHDPAHRRTARDPWSGIASPVRASGGVTWWITSLSANHGGLALQGLDGQW